MKRLLLACLSFGVLAGAIAATPILLGADEDAQAVVLPEFDPAAPLVVVLRGWLWDPDSRKGTPELVEFPANLDEAMQRRSLAIQIRQWDWSRLPARLLGSRGDFIDYSRALGAKAAAAGHCVNFIGHSAGAALVYSAAADGVQMGFMGTLGLPTAGQGKPESVSVWANFFTTTQLDDYAGRLWGPQMRADANVDLKMPHRHFWASKAAAETIAEGVAEAWEVCRP